MELEVQRIHACPNDCMLYRNQFEKTHTCYICGEPRYKRKNDTGEYDDDVTKNGPAAKVLWYFPIIPRLKRLFANPKESKLLRWHSDERKDDGKLRHVADSPQWRNFDYDYPDFGNEGPKQPGNDIDVYLSPLIDDLKALWSPGVEMYDAYEKVNFTLLLGLLLNIPGKTKDGINARRDMEAMGIRKELAPVERANSIYLPPACYTMSGEEKRKFCECLHDIKVLSNYSTNIKSLVSMKDCKLLGMKSYDCHVLMMHMIPIAIRGLLLEEVRHTITKLCLFFNMIHSKVIDPEVLDKWEKDIYITLCELEMYFPPSFFDIMVHLVSHVVKEIKSCGPVFLRYMYPFERYMGVLKGYVRNRNQPEGYLEGVKSIGVPKSRHSGRLAGAGGVGKQLITPPSDELQIAHFTVLQHMICIAPYVNEHKKILRLTHLRKSNNWYAKQHNKGFSAWLKKKVEETYGEPNVDKTVERLGMGPDFRKFGVGVAIERENLKIKLQYVQNYMDI
ncbi:uncharacterized protein LOC110890160 [Helianthus annuus]|uniref:uncharacterized protein LOC110890160 n=1 Tax=Helianthus annuus TaxID=4232 RepID=UPI000B90711A|nr:uncharacterized protein LOC110890160 [Helianthus annuus]